MVREETCSLNEPLTEPRALVAEPLGVRLVRKEAESAKEEDAENRKELAKTKVRILFMNNRMVRIRKTIEADFSDANFSDGKKNTPVGL